MSSDPHAYVATGLSQGKRPHACVLTIFGASGDLTKRKLIPALYNLALEKRLPERFAVVGYARSEMSHEEFREKMRAAVSEFSRTGLKDESVWRQFAATLYYVAGSYEGLEGYRRLKEFIEGFDHGSRALPVRVFYLATPPDLYGPVIQKIAAVRLASRESDGAPRTRVIIEKPFGTDLQTARELNHVVHEVLDEQQVDDATLVLADQSRKAIAQIVALAQELLSGKMAAEKASAIAQRLASGEWTHDFPITVEAAKQLIGLPLSTEMPEQVFQVVRLYPQERERQPSVFYLPGPRYKTAEPAGHEAALR
jgi:hypothetical protein